VTNRRLKVFTHVDTEKSPLYRAILRTFAAARARFALHLRPSDVWQALVDNGKEAHWDRGQVDAALQQLCEWGNLEAHPDLAEVAVVEDFYRPRFLYQLTPEGEAAERALELFHDSLRQPGELQAAALADIRADLTALIHLSEEVAPDQTQVCRLLSSLQSRFEELTAKAQSFLAGLQRTIDLQGIEIEQFLAYKQRLIEYLNRFVGELILAHGEIVGRLKQLDDSRITRLLRIAAERELADVLDPTEEQRRAVHQDWLARWKGLRAWFLSGSDAPPQSEVLRARAREAIPVLLAAVANINERRSSRSDRIADLRTLARWFAETDSDAEAHRLWQAAFGLNPSRHWQIDAESLAAREESPVSPQTSWLDAPPLLISPRLRRSGRHAGRGRSANVIDRTREKEQLARTAAEEARQIAAAQQRLAAGRVARLSEIGELDPVEFQLFLDLLGEALAARTGGNRPVEATSSDGTLQVTLAPTGDGHTATIQSSAGTFSGEDYFVTIRPAVEMMPAGGELREQVDTSEEAGKAVDVPASGGIR